MQIHITEKMIDASIEAARVEAVKDGHDWPEPDQYHEAGLARFREVVRAMLQAAANTLSQPD